MSNVHCIFVWINDLHILTLVFNDDRIDLTNSKIVPLNICIISKRCLIIYTMDTGQAFNGQAAALRLYNWWWFVRWWFILTALSPTVCFNLNIGWLLNALTVLHAQRIREKKRNAHIHLFAWIILLSFYIFHYSAVTFLWRLNALTIDIEYFLVGIIILPHFSPYTLKS